MLIDRAVIRTVSRKPRFMTPTSSSALGVRRAALVPLATSRYRLLNWPSTRKGGDPYRDGEERRLLSAWREERPHWRDRTGFSGVRGPL